MAATDEDALICDLAETYHVYDYQDIPCELAAKLAAGLRESSRSRMRMAGRQITPEVLLNAVCADRLGLLVWFQTKDGRRNRNRPRSFVAALCGGKTEKDIRKYSSGAEFEAERARILASIKE